VIQGVHQGDLLSGPLFIIAMESLLQAIPHITGLTFADVPSIPHSLTSFSDDLTIILTCLASLGTKLTTGLELNKDKSKLILAQEPTSHSFF